MSWVQVVHWIGDQIGGWYGAEVFATLWLATRRDDVAINASVRLGQDGYL